MKIVVGFSGTAESWAALRWAMEQAAPRDDELLVVTSLRTGQQPSAEEQQVWTYREALEEAEQQLRAAGLSYKIKGIALEGYSPADAINYVVSDEKAGLVVIGIRSRSRVGKFLLGSDAQEILLTADCPVVGVKARAGGEVAGD